VRRAYPPHRAEVLTLQLRIVQLITRHLHPSRGFYNRLSVAQQSDITLSAVSRSELTACHHNGAFYAFTQEHTVMVGIDSEVSYL